jgi:hypothetical protein
MQQNLVVTNLKYFFEICQEKKPYQILAALENEVLKNESFEQDLEIQFEDREFWFKLTGVRVHDFGTFIYYRFMEVHKEEI